MRVLILSLLTLFYCNSALSQLRIVPGSIEEMNFGVFYLTGNGAGSITINPASPMSSTYFGIEYPDISTIRPFSFRLEKTEDKRLTIKIGKGGAGSTLQSKGPHWGHSLRTLPNSYVIWVEGDVLQSFTQDHITFREGRGTVTVKVGATLTIPPNSKEVEYVANSQYILNYYTWWQVIQ